jgi:sulfofructose kinase
MRVPLTLPPADREVDVVTLGENSLDFVAVAADVAPSAGKRPLTSFRIEPGGQMATAALACSRLGLRVRYIGAFGDDEWSDRARAPLDDSGIDVVAVRRAGIPGRIAVIVVDAAGERLVHEHRHPALAVAGNDVPDNAVAGARILLCDATHPDASARALAIAREAGTVSVCDVDIVTPEAVALVSEVDIAIAPAPFVTTWAGTDDLRGAVDRLAAYCHRAALIVVTRGAEGSVAFCRGEWVESPGIPVDVVDTTGAGDAFRAGFVSALVRLGPDASLAEVLAFANATGALNCRAVGAQRGLPGFEDVVQHLR